MGPVLQGKCLTWDPHLWPVGGCPSDMLGPLTGVIQASGFSKDLGRTAPIKFLSSSHPVVPSSPIPEYPSPSQCPSEFQLYHEAHSWLRGKPNIKMYKSLGHFLSAQPHQPCLSMMQLGHGKEGCFWPVPRPLPSDRAPLLQIQGPTCAAA